MATQGQEIVLARSTRNLPGTNYAEAVVSQPDFGAKFDQYKAGLLGRIAVLKETPGIEPDSEALVGVQFETSLVGTFIKQQGYINFTDFHKEYVRGTANYGAFGKARSNFLSGLALKSKRFGKD